MTGRGEWVLSLEESARRFSIIFVHLGHFFRPVLDDLIDINGTHLTIEQYLSALAPESPSLLVLTDFERVAKIQDVTIGQLRERVLADVAKGHIFILVSSLASDAYEPSPGSDLLPHAQQAFAPFDEQSVLNPLTVLPAFVPESQEVVSLFVGCLNELGSASALALSKALWEENLTPGDTLTFLPTVQLEILRAAGLLRLNENSYQWTIGAYWTTFRNAVAYVSSRSVKESAWLRGTFGDLWVIERLLRNVIRDGLIEECGDGWKENCLSSELGLDVLRRAREEMQPNAQVLDDLRDPLEWLTTAELLHLRRSRGMSGFGLDEPVWTRFESVIVPIRNRAAHVRPLSVDDASSVRSWRALAEKHWV